ncbi:MAG: helix-hairpin-helix domain-containing protein [bacterium]
MKNINREGRQLINITIICIISTILYISVRWYTHYKDVYNRTINYEDRSYEIDSLIAHLDTITRKSDYFPKSEPLPAQRTFAFDPNKADSIELLELGFKPFMAHNLLSYRRKGGVIRNSDKFKQIYGIDTLLIASLDKGGYILYPPPTNYLQTADDTANTEKKYIAKSYFEFELNSADTALLQLLPNIGSSRARQIVAFRNILGGYHSASQLSEIEFFPDSIVKKLEPYISINTDSIRLININKSSIRTLKQHPYINYYQAKAIYDTRWDKEHKGKITIEELENIKDFAPEELEKLLPYLCE